MLTPILLLIVGFVLLIKGGDWFVDGATGIARRFHLPEILIGANVRGETSWEEDIHDEGYVIRAAGDHITITGKTSRGVLYGVYGFLEKFLNYRCFTKDIETIDSVDVFELELDEIKVEPSFDFRDAYFRHAFDGNFASKNRLKKYFQNIK